MRILVACEESQAVTIEFRKLGHEAYSCDTQPCSGGYPEWHLQQDVTLLLQQKWDMIIAFPPCTYLSNAGACRLYPTKGKLNEDRFKKGLIAKEFFMLFYNSKCEKVAIENPVSSLVFEMPKHTQEIQPFQFGHSYRKNTRLWLKGLPNLKPTQLITENIRPWVGGGSRKHNGEKREQEGVHRDKTVRSKTFTGVAKAMAEQWSVISFEDL